mgnify:FL=1
MENNRRMNRIHHYLWLVICFCLSVCAIGEVSAQIVINADFVAQLGQTFRLCYQYSTNDSIERIISPNWDWEKNNNGFDILMGPSRSSQTSTTVTNGRISTTYGETFTFLLSFNKEGNYSMPLMKAQTESGKNLVSKPFSVRATKEAVSSTSNNSSTQRTSKNDLLVVEATVNKHRISLGDSVICEIRLYTNLNISQMSSSSTLAICPAYWHEHELPREKSFETVEYKGDSVRSVLWQKVSIIPMQAGEIVLEPMKFTATRMDYNSGVDPFEAFFNGGGMYIARDTVILTNPIKIQVEKRQLPDKVIAFDSKPTHNMGLVIDRSSSLKAQSDSLAPTYLQLENLFVEQLAKSKDLSDYSVTLFAGKPHFTKSSHLSEIIKMLPSEENDGSAIYDAILASALRDGALTKERPQYSVLLLTDGSDNRSRLSEKTLTNILLQHHIRVDVISFASGNDSVYYFMNDTIGGTMIKNTQDFSDVERIAEATGGLFIQINDKQQIADAIRKVKNLQLRHAPYRLPDNDFLPEPYLLNLYYKEIEQDSMKGF